MVCVVCVNGRAKWMITYSSRSRCGRTGTHLVHLIATLALQPGPVDGAHQSVAEILAEQTVDVERDRVVNQLQQIGQCAKNLKRKAGQHLRCDSHVQYGHGRDAQQKEYRCRAEQQKQSSLLGKLPGIVVLHVAGTGQHHLATTLAGATIDKHDAQIEAGNEYGRYELEDHLQHDLIHRVEDRLLIDGVVASQIDVGIVRGQHALDQLTPEDAGQVDDEGGETGEEDNHPARPRSATGKV